MGLEWHNRKRSMDGRFARRAQAMADEAGIEIDQLHIRLPKSLADEIRFYARNMQMEIGELVTLALIKCVDELQRIEDRHDQQRTTEEATDDQQRQTMNTAEVDQR